MNDGRQSLLGKSPGIQKAEKVAALPQLGDAQFGRTRPRLPVVVAVAVELGEMLSVLPAISSTGQAAHLQLHQPLRGKADHLPQEIAVSRFLNQRVQVHLLIGHRCLRKLRSQAKLTQSSPMTTPGTYTTAGDTTSPSTALAAVTLSGDSGSHTRRLVV